MTDLITLRTFLIVLSLCNYCKFKKKKVDIQSVSRFRLNLFLHYNYQSLRKTGGLPSRKMRNSSTYVVLFISVGLFKSAFEMCSNKMLSKSMIRQFLMLCIAVKSGGYNVYFGYDSGKLKIS